MNHALRLGRRLLPAALLLVANASALFAQDDEFQESGGDPWVGYALALAVAGAGVFLVCKSARRS
jgi:hypothetical protein